MALINLDYCSAAHNRPIRVVYNNSTHTIQSGAFNGLICFDTVGSNYVLYQYVVGLTEYKVKTQVAAPYAYVSSSPVSSCNITLTGPTISNASFNDTSNGSISVQGSLGAGFFSGTWEFSLNGGTWTTGPNVAPSTKVWTGLTPGNYNVRVRFTFSNGVTCLESRDVTVGFNDVRCNLELGTIQVIKANGGSDGEIRILTVNDPIGLELEYRINAGAWQSTPVFTGLAAGDYDVQVRYKNYSGCGDMRDVELFNDVTCDARITDISVTHEQSKYADDGLIIIVATTTHEPLEYSIDGGATYQEENAFPGLEPGIYQVRIKDAEGCEDVLSVEVLKYRLPFVEYPVINSLRAVVLSAGLQNFDNTLLKNFKMPGVTSGCYFQKVKLVETNTQQFRSNYRNNVVRIYDQNDALIQSLTPLKMTNNLDKAEVFENAMFANAGAGETQVFFSVPMPDFFEVGQDIEITDLPSMNGTYRIKDIRAGTLSAAGYQVLIIDKVWPGGTVLQATLTIIYDALPYEVYEFSLIWSLFGLGDYYFIIQGSDDQFPTYYAPSEPITVANEWADCLQIDYYNFEDAHKVLYSTGIKYRVHVDGFLDWPKPGGDRVVYRNSKNKLIKIQENVERRHELKVFDIPGYLREKLALIFGHDFFAINDVEYQTEEDFAPESFANDALGNGTVIVTQADFDAENSDDQGDVDTPVLEVDGTLLSINP